MNFKKSFCWRSNQSNFRSENTPLFLRPGLKKRCGKGHFFLSEIGSGSTCTPTKISQEQPPPGETSRTRLVSSIPLCTRDLCEFKIFNYSVYRCQALLDCSCRIFSIIRHHEQMFLLFSEHSTASMILINPFAVVPALHSVLYDFEVLLPNLK